VLYLFAFYFIDLRYYRGDCQNKTWSSKKVKTTAAKPKENLNQLPL
jgi:hypothetical protein